MACSSDSDRVSASRTTASSETSNIRALAAVAEAEGGVMLVALVAPGLGKEIVAVADRLDEDEHAVKDHRQGADEHELGRRILRTELRQSEVRQDERQDREREEHAQGRGRAPDAERLFVVAHAADQQAKADHAVQHDRHGGKHRVAGKGILYRAARQHRRDDQRGFDHGDGERQQHRAERLADLERDHLCVMHGGEDRDEQEQSGEERDPDGLGMQEAGMFEAEHGERRNRRRRDQPCGGAAFA